MPTIELTDDELNFMHELVDDALSANDIDKQDKAIELQNTLPEQTQL